MRLYLSCANRVPYFRFFFGLCWGPACLLLSHGFQALLDDGFTCHAPKAGCLHALLQSYHCPLHSRHSKMCAAGIIVVEGLGDAVRDFTAEIRSMKWQAMQVRLLAWPSDNPTYASIAPFTLL